MIHMMLSEYRGCKNNYALDLGDPIEAIQVDDPRYHYSTVNPKTPLPMLQMYQAIKHRKPIAHLILGMNESNHPRKLWRFGPITETICNELKIPFATWSSKYILRDSRGQLMYKVYTTHGRLAINSRARDPKQRRLTNELTLKNQLSPMMADCIIQAKAHIHKIINCHPESELYMTDDGDKIKQGYTQDGEIDQTASYIHPDNRYYIAVGSFLRLYGEGVSGYAEIAEYPPIELGFQIAYIRNKHVQGIDPIYLD